jgi:hypothetical protein
MIFPENRFPLFGIMRRPRALPLAGFEAPIGLVDDINPALAPDNLVVAVAAAQGFQRITDFHDGLWVQWLPGS